MCILQVKVIYVGGQKRERIVCAVKNRVSTRPFFKVEKCFMEFVV